MCCARERELIATATTSEITQDEGNGLACSLLLCVQFFNSFLKSGSGVVCWRCELENVKNDFLLKCWEIEFFISLFLLPLLNCLPTFRSPLKQCFQRILTQHLEQWKTGLRWKLGRFWSGSSANWKYFAISHSISSQQDKYDELVYLHFRRFGWLGYVCISSFIKDWSSQRAFHSKTILAFPPFQLAHSLWFVIFHSVNSNYFSCHLCLSIPSIPTRNDDKKW